MSIGLRETESNSAVEILITSYPVDCFGSTCHCTLITIKLISLLLLSKYTYSYNVYYYYCFTATTAIDNNNAR